MTEINRVVSSNTRRDFLKRSAAAGVGLVAAPYVLTDSKVLAADEAKPDAEGFISLFDGETLAGWHKNPQRIGHGTGGLWEVKDGAITGEQDPPASGNGGILLTDRKFGDFELHLDMMPDWGPDSGLFLRSNDAGQCIQMMVDYHDGGNVGHLYGEGTGGWNTRPFDLFGQYDNDKKLTGFTTKPTAGYDQHPLIHTATAEEWVKAWKISDWNHVKVLCVGEYPKITTWINDLKVCEWDGATWEHKQYDKEQVRKTLGREGSIAVQVHGGKGAWPAGAKCRWKNIRVKPM